MNEESVKASNELVRWLKMLALPGWARLTLALIMLLILFSALALLLWGLWGSDHEAISSAVGMLTVGIPVGLIVIALVFGDGGARKLKTLTQLVLNKEVPQAILENLSINSNDSRYQDVRIANKIRGCIADYTLTVADSAHGEDRHSRRRHLEFKLELNVKKVNLVLWLADVTGTALEHYGSCFFGAEKEGYVRNQTPLRGEKHGRTGIVFIKSLGEDFLLNPAARLYFAQDLAFFIRGLLDAETPHVQ